MSLLRKLKMTQTIIDAVGSMLDIYAQEILILWIVIISTEKEIQLFWGTQPQ